MGGITPADLAAAEAVVRDAGESADSIGFEEAADLLQALDGLENAVKDTKALLRTELLRQVEKQPRRHNGITYDRRPKRTWIFDHEKIREAIARQFGVGQAYRSIVDALDAHAAVYISPSTTAKVGGLKKIGLDKKDAGSYRNDGYELDVVDTNIRDEDDDA